MYQFLLKLIIDKFKRVNVSDGPTYLPTDEWRDVANYFFLIQWSLLKSI